MTTARIIRTKADIIEGVTHLLAECPHMRTAHGVVGIPPLRRRKGGFEGLAAIVVSQQLSKASADAIWCRLKQALVPFTPERLLTMAEEDVRAVGLSRPKIRTLRAVSEALVKKNLRLNAISKSSPEEIHAALTAVSGIGPWSADIYIMFCLGHADAFAPGDLALQLAAQDLTQSGQRLSTEELAELAESWHPWRSVAARLLWAYYAYTRRRGGLPV